MSYVPFSDRDWSLKPDQWRRYRALLRALFDLRSENKYVIPFGMLGERSGLSENDAYQAATELKQNGFFDQRSREIGVISLRQDEVERGYRRTAFDVIRSIIRSSRSWQVLALIAAAITSLLVWISGNLLWDSIGPLVRATFWGKP